MGPRGGSRPPLLVREKQLLVGALGFPAGVAPPPWLDDAGPAAHSPSIMVLLRPPTRFFCFGSYDSRGVLPVPLGGRSTGRWGVAWSRGRIVVTSQARFSPYLRVH